MTEGRYRIAEVAERTGFSSPTLRYYEQIGLLPAAERSPAGYRLYDDRSIERLTFITRAKQLGCTLEEITDLADAWSTNECAPIKHRLRDLVATKLAATEARIAELTALAAELRSTSLVLKSAPLDGPCDETCGCVSGPRSTSVVVPLTTKGARRDG
jgi:MerR family copper efflux transcriptional regulator